LLTEDTSSNFFFFFFFFVKKNATNKHCRQPLAFLSFFNQHDRSGGHHDQHGNNGITCTHPDEQQHQQQDVAPPLPGAYVLPKFCEYCQASSTTNCPPHCTRPKLYFQKKRPPFCKRNPVLWNDETDHAIPRDTALYPISPRPHHSKNNSNKDFSSSYNKKTTAPSSSHNSIQLYHSRQHEVLATNNNNAVIMASSPNVVATPMVELLEHHAASTSGPTTAFSSHHHPQQQQQQQQHRHRHRSSWLSMFATSAE
jgi:hypothetical protein